MRSVHLIVLVSTTVMAIALVTKADEDENEGSLTVFEILQKANANSTIRMIQGDIVPNLKRNADPCTSSGCMWQKSKQNQVRVPYKLSTDFTRSQRKFIRKILKGFQKSTCVRFVKKKSKHTNYVNIIASTGCWSYVGRIGGKQDLSLQRNGCLYKSIVQHEVLHALGFHHEHSRSDRDDYVIVNFENILDGLENNFQKLDTNNLNTPYDFNSVMQYPNKGFSKNGLPTLVAKSDPNLVLGTATEMSQNDFDRINALYGCNL